MNNNEKKSTKPLDVKSGWLSVVRRCQSIAKTDGMALVSITVLVDNNGNPCFWLSPTVKKIEPKRTTYDMLNQMLQALNDDMDI